MQSLGRTGMSSSAPEVQIHSQDNQAAPGASLPTATCSAQPEPLVSREWVTVLKCSDDQSNNTGEPGPGCAHPQPSAPLFHSDPWFVLPTFQTPRPYATQPHRLGQTPTRDEPEPVPAASTIQGHKGRRQIFD